MTPKELYNEAERFAWKVPAMYREDVVQDAVVTAWQKSKARVCNASFLRQSLARSVLDGLKKYFGQERPGVEVGEMLETPSSLACEDVMLSLPLNGFERQLVETVIRCNFELEVAAKELNVTLPTMKYRWKKSLRLLRTAYRTALT